jgi:hypothetical protein
MTPPAAAKGSPLVIIAIVIVIGIAVYLVATRGVSASPAGVTPGISDATSAALLQAQTTFDTNSTQLAIAKAADATSALASYAQAQDTLAATIAQITGATQQAQISAGSASQIAQIQQNGAVAIANAQAQASVASSQAQLGEATVVADSATAQSANVSQAAVQVSSQQAQAAVQAAQAQASAQKTASTNGLIGNIFGGLLAGIGL